MEKSKVVESKEALEIIIAKLSNEDTNIHLVDKHDRFSVVLDNIARTLLSSYYKTKL